MGFGRFDTVYIGAEMKLTGQGLGKVYSLYIGIVTLVISLLGFWLSRILKRISIVSKFADFIGGIILIIFGLKMIFF